MSKFWERDHYYLHTYSKNDMNKALDKQTDYREKIKKYHKLSARHVLVLETDLSFEDRCKVFHYSDLIRKAGNELVAIMQNNYQQMIRTKKYRKLISLYGTYVNAGNKEKQREISEQLKELLVQHNVTWQFCRTSMIPIGKKYGIGSVFALTKAEDIWSSVEKCLYAGGKKIHFSSRNELPAIRAKQPNGGIRILAVDDQLQFRIKEIVFGVKIKDRFEADEVAAIIDYMRYPVQKDMEAISTLQRDNICISTYRPCYATIVCKKIRGKLRVYVHITIEGVPCVKYDKNGKPRQLLGKGTVGCLVNGQSIAYTSDLESRCKKLAERSSSIQKKEQKELEVFRAMDRSIRAINFQGHHRNSEMKRDGNHRNISKRYRKLRDQYADLSRINSINRHLAINEEVNYIRSLGDTLIIMDQSKKTLHRYDNNLSRKEHKQDEIKIIPNRCSGYYLSQIKKRFTKTDGMYIEMKGLNDEIQVDSFYGNDFMVKDDDQPDRLKNTAIEVKAWYISFLLYCMDVNSKKINRNKYVYQFENALYRYNQMN